MYSTVTDYLESLGYLNPLAEDSNDFRTSTYKIFSAFVINEYFEEIFIILRLEIEWKYLNVYFEYEKELLNKICIYEIEELYEL